MYSMRLKEKKLDIIAVSVNDLILLAESVVLVT